VTVEAVDETATRERSDDVPRGLAGEQNSDVADACT
jgi:hypothetical protein